MVVNPGELSVSTQPPNLITPTGINQFTQIGTAAQVRESDGCASGLQSEFSSNSPAIYITARVLNAVAGATVGAEWIYEGNVIFQSSSYSIPEDDDDFCLWFYIEPTDVQFTPGNWLARFTLNGTAVEPTASFTIN
jgi:hypothetical protein